MRLAITREVALKLVDEECKSRRFIEHSRRGIHEVVWQFHQWAVDHGQADIGKLGKKDLVAYHTWLTKQPSKRTGEPLRPATINNRFSAIGLLYSCLYRSGLIPENPMHRLSLKVADPGGYRRRPLGQDEITSFLESIDTTTPQGLKDRTLFELIYSSGLRVNEAASLKVGAIDFACRFMVVRGKYDKDRKVPVSEVAMAFLKLYVGSRSTDLESWVFMGSAGPTKGGHLRSTRISERFRTLLRRYGMDKPEISTHSIRHSTATHLLEAGASVRHVQELLGHACIESTVRYTHVMTDNLAKVYRRYHPREHELFEVIDAEYENRFRAILGHVSKREKWLLHDTKIENA